MAENPNKKAKTEHKPAVDGGLLSYDPALLDALDNTSQRDVVVPLQAISEALTVLMNKTSGGDLVLFRNQAQAYTQATVSSMPIQTLGQPPFGQLQAGNTAQVCIKTGYVADDAVFVSKVAGGGGSYYDTDEDKKQGKLTQTGNTGMVLVFSQKTLKLNKILLDEGILTEVRTAAASVLASKLLFPSLGEGEEEDDVEAIGIVGGGVQAIWQLRFLLGITKCRRVVIKTRSEASTQNFIKRMSESVCAMDREWNISPVSPESSFRDCRLIHTLTYSRTPVLDIDDVDLSRPLHITAVGADSPGKQELGISLVQRAQLRVCDSKAQSKERGELQHLFKENGAWQQQDCELGEMIKQAAAGAGGSDGNGGGGGEGWTEAMEGVISRRGVLRGVLGAASSSPLFSLFDTSGMAVQDILIAKLVAQTIDQLP